MTKAGQAAPTARSVYGNFWREYNQVSKHVGPEPEGVPDIELVADDQDTSHRC
ncbi:hypothetical protein ACFYZ3_31230 [Streptomyces sp. NPDC001599]|uniref:hypothetical protein n=1 Tax=Streptomyces sp. NPDC001599 TaxID=3364591 RepID=UPI00367FAEF6